MTGTTYPDTTLVLLGHGTTLNPQSALPVLEQANAIQRLRLFASVEAAFWKQEPQVASVLGRVCTPRILIVPCFLSEGYFSDQLIPKALGFPERDANGDRVRTTADQTLIYSRPVGVHPRLTDVALARASSVVAAAPFPVCPKPAEISLFIAGHGTERNANSRSSVEIQVERIRQTNVYACVHGIFMEEEPRIAAAYELASTKYLVVVPFFLGDGLHAQEDIPVMLGEHPEKVRQRVSRGLPGWHNPTERQGKLVWYSGSIGTDPAMVRVVLDIGEESLARCTASA